VRLKSVFTLAHNLPDCSQQLLSLLVTQAEFLAAFFHFNHQLGIFDLCPDKK